MGVIEKQSIQDIADAIRDRNGLTTLYKPRQMDEAIRGLYKTEAVNHIFDNLTISTTAQGTSFTITDADTTKQAEITEMLGDTIQEGTPTPSSPVEIETVSGENNIVVSNKNLINITDRSGTISNFYYYDIPTNYLLEVGETYTVSYDAIVSLEPFNVSVGAGTTGYQRDIKTITGKVSGNIEITFTPTEYQLALGKKLYLRVPRYNTPQTSDYEIKNIQLEKGNVATEYTQHKGVNYLIDLKGKNLFNDILRQGVTIYNTGVWGASNSRITSTNWIKNVKAGTYTISAKTSTTKTLQVSMITFNTSGVFNNVSGVSGQWKTMPFTFTIPIDMQLKCNISYTDNSNITPSEVIEVQLESGNVETEYSPSNPIELCKIGNYQDKLLQSKGNNLYNGFSFSKTTSGIAFTYNTDGSIKVNGTATANATSMYSSEATSYLFTLSSGAYTLSGVGLTANVRVEIVKSNGTLLAQTDNNLYKNFTINEDTNVFLRVYIASGTTVNNLFIYPMLNKGTTALPYEPYGVGKWYIEKNIGKVVLNGTQDWYYYTETSKPVFYLICEQYGINYKQQSGLLCYSNYYEGKGQVASFDNVYNLGNNVIAFRTSFTRFVIRNDSITSVEELKTWLSTHNTTVYYVKQTPTTEEITDSYLLEQLNNILDIELYENPCYVDWEGTKEPTMKLTYYVDTDKILEKLREE